MTSPFRSPCHPASRQALASRCAKRYQSDNTSDQAHPFQGYYTDMLDAPLHSVRPLTKTQPKPPPPDELPKTEDEEKIAKARVVFGSRLAGPVERRAAIRSASQDIAGILVPPRPEEPDNCCNSGCVNCVWDTYREDLEEWAEKSAEARTKIMTQRTQGQATGLMNDNQNMPHHVAVSMDDDGGGSETNFAGSESFGQGGTDLFADIPVGIREFMKTEKRLKEKLKKLQAASG